MCGFVGFNGSDAHILEKMVEAIKHRGPDSSGIYVDADISMGMRRLSIIGLNDGDQPIYNENRTIAVVFNGEIYNYKELKRQLSEKGHIFYTNTDTEVLVHAYEEYADDMVGKLRGMFAFALYDIPKKRLLLARDFFGIKPLYYYNKGGLFIFGSEIKAFIIHPGFKKVLNEAALSSYLMFQYSVLDETFFSGVFKLKPGHRLVYENGEIKTTRYFEADFTPAHMGLDEAAAAIDNAVQESVYLHREASDVEVGAFLSGGVDSGYIALCLGSGKTFTVGFDYEKYSEIGEAKNLSELIGASNYSTVITTDEYWEHLPKVQYHMDEPLADPSAVALYFVSKLASKYVKIALSGEGADEFFGGYNIYKEPLDLKALTSLPKPIRKLLGMIANAIPFNIKGKNYLARGSKTLEERFIGNAYIFNKNEIKAILKTPNSDKLTGEITRPYYDKFGAHDDITKMQLLDINLWMVGDILLKADKMSMAHSLEVRVPYLDIEVFKTAQRIPTNLRVNKKSTKYAFRQAAKKHLPDNAAKRRKLGFPVPIRVWLKEDKYYDIVRGYFTGKTADKYFKDDKLLALLDGHKKGKADNSRKIWTVFMFLLWHNEFFGGAA